MTPSKTEEIEWYLVEDSLPDSDITVLIACPEESDPVWIGAYSDEEDEWVTVEGVPIVVSAWAEMPKGIANDVR